MSVLTNFALYVIDKLSGQASFLIVTIRFFKLVQHIFSKLERLVERQLCACVFTSAVSGCDVIKWSDDAIKSRLEKEWCGDSMFGFRVLHPVHCGSELSLSPGFHHVTNIDYKCSYDKTRAKEYFYSETS